MVVSIVFLTYFKGFVGSSSKEYIARSQNERGLLKVIQDGCFFWLSG